MRFGGELWSNPRQPGWTDMEYQLRNWLYYDWLSGDFITEQAVHSLDLMAWVLKDKLPVRAIGTGGRQKRTDPIYEIGRASCRERGQEGVVHGMGREKTDN